MEPLGILLRLAVLAILAAVLFIHATWALVVAAYALPAHPIGMLEVNAAAAFSLLAIVASVGLTGAAVLKRVHFTFVFAGLLLLGWMGMEGFQLQLLLVYGGILAIVFVFVGVYWQNFEVTIVAIILTGMYLLVSFLRIVLVF